VAKAFSLRNDRKQKSIMKPQPQETEKDLGKDLKTFDHLAAKTQKLELLRHQAEKATGQENVALHKMIGEKSKQGSPQRSSFQL
jgi:hypothetical protein